ncbi:hypothetical protein [Kitasatospora sp. NPDC057541]|uniref:hypothetical protein n=1 Tax=unclassified Kitasatospora TaxID=2633591 RepID=UPI0036994C3D
MATLTLARPLLPAQRGAPQHQEAPVSPRPAPPTRLDDIRRDLVVQLLAEQPTADTAELVALAHQRHGGSERVWRPVVTAARDGLRDRLALAAETGVSRATLGRLWADRDNNGHPPAVKVEGVMHWCLPQWQQWHTALAEATVREVHTEAGGIHRDGDPDELVPLRELGRILGHKDGTTVAGWRKSPPAGAIGDLLRGEPDGEVLYRGQLQPAYRRSRLWEAAAAAPTRGRGGGPRGAGRKRTKSYPWQGDPRLALARQLLADHPGSTITDLAARAHREGGQDTAEDTWRQILTAARTHPETP